jgi:hypothetical protein
VRLWQCDEDCSGEYFAYAAANGPGAGGGGGHRHEDRLRVVQQAGEGEGLCEYLTYADCIVQDVVCWCMSECMSE